MCLWSFEVCRAVFMTLWNVGLCNRNITKCDALYLRCNVATVLYRGVWDCRVPFLLN